MKRIGLLAMAAVPRLCLAGDGLFGTKTGGTSSFDSSASSPVGGMAAVQLLVALGLVLLLIRFVLPKVLTKVNRRLNTNLSSGIRIEESANFAGGNLYVVSARAKTLLLCVTGNAVTCLADISETQQPTPEIQTFHEMLEQAPGHTAPIVNDSTADLDPFAETLARLDHLDRLTQS